MADSVTVTAERDGHVLLMGLNRPHKRNAFSMQMLAELSRAYALLEHDDDLRAGVLFGHGEHFTAGLDLLDVYPALVSGQSLYPTTVWTPGGWTTPGPNPSSPSPTAGA
jgi:enoyl-CoA hydratase